MDICSFYGADVRTELGEVGSPAHISDPPTSEPATLHTPPILPPHLKQRIGNLPERATPHRVHQHFEHVLIVDHRLLQAEEHGAGLVLVPRLEAAQAL